MKNEEEFDIFKFKKDDNNYKHLIIVLNTIYKGDATFSYDSGITIAKQGQKSFSIKTVFGSNYILLSVGGNDKIQIVYDSKFNTSELVTNKLKGFINQILSGTKKDFNDFNNEKQQSDLSDLITTKLGLIATKTKCRDGDGYYYRVKTHNLDALHISEDGKHIINIKFKTCVDSVKNIDKDNLYDIVDNMISEVKSRKEIIESILNKLR